MKFKKYLYLGIIRIFLGKREKFGQRDIDTFGIVFSEEGCQQSYTF